MYVVNSAGNAAAPESKTVAIDSFFQGTGDANKESTMYTLKGKWFKSI
jgi:hypothetical protein